MSIFVTNRAHGPDGSKYDLKFVPEEATHQMDFVIQRVSYRLTRDEAFDVLYLGVSRMPIRLAYHYHNTGVPWKDQADLFLSIVEGKGFHAYACDFEGAYNVLSLQFARDTYEWIKYVAQQTAKPVLLYTSLSLYNSWISVSKTQQGLPWDSVDLWQAQWPYVPNPNGTPTNPSGRTGGWKFWQYQSNADGTKYGMARPTACDLNVFNGPVSDLRSYLKLDQPSPPPVVVNPVATVNFTDTSGREFTGTVELKPK